MSRAPSTTLIVDDVTDARQWLAAAAREAFPTTTVVFAATLADALAAVERAPPELALVDLGLPDGSGQRVIEALARRSPPCPSVVTTVFADDQHIFPALRAGAAGYVLKDQSQQALAEMLRELFDGMPALSPAIARRLVGFFRADDSSQDELLTPRERDVLVLLAKGLTIAAAARALGIAPSTVASYVKIVYRKLDVSNRAEAVLEAARRGLIAP